MRRNAVLAVFTIYRAFPDLFPDAPEEIEKFLEEVRYWLCLCNVVGWKFLDEVRSAVAFLLFALLCKIRARWNPLAVLIHTLSRLFFPTQLQESDAGTRRNAFIMMFNCATDQAIAWLGKNAEKVLQVRAY